MLVKELQEEVANHLGDAMMEFVLPHQLLTFINSAARDLINSGWLLPIDHAEGVEMLVNEFEYDVPSGFAYIKDIRVGSQTASTAATVDTGTLLDGAISNTTDTAITVDDGSIFSINDMFQVGTEIFLITAITANVLTTRRGHFSTTAVSHLDEAIILRPFANMEFDHIIPKAYWRLKQQSGGGNTLTAARASRAQVVFLARFFSVNPGAPLQFNGQQRPNVYTSGSTTIDHHMESFLRERALAYAARYAVARGRVALQQIASDSFAISEQFLGRHPQEFRVHPSSTRVPGR